MIEIVTIFILILLNGLFSMAETAVVSSNKIRLENESEEGNTNAKRALDIANNPNKFFSTVQIGITLIGIVSGAYGGATLAEKLNVLLIDVPFGKYSETISYALVILSITYLSIVIGE